MKNKSWKNHRKVCKIWKKNMEWFDEELIVYEQIVNRWATYSWQGDRWTDRGAGATDSRCTIWFRFASHGHHGHDSRYQPNPAREAGNPPRTGVLLRRLDRSLLQTTPIDLAVQSARFRQNTANSATAFQNARNGCSHSAPTYTKSITLMVRK